MKHWKNVAAKRLENVVEMMGRGSVPTGLRARKMKYVDVHVCKSLRRWL